MPSLQEGGLAGLPVVRVSDEGLPSPRVARAQETIKLHPLLYSKHLPKGAVKVALDCAHRATTVLLPFPLRAD